MIIYTLIQIRKLLQEFRSRLISIETDTEFIFKLLNDIHYTKTKKRRVK